MHESLKSVQEKNLLMCKLCKLKHEIIESSLSGMASDEAKAKMWIKYTMAERVKQKVIC